MPNIIKIRSDTKTNWEFHNPILNESEICLETDNNRIKIGNGINRWSELDYFPNNNSVSSNGYPANYALISDGNGFCKFDNLNELVKIKPTLKIPKEIYINNEVMIKITNYDSFIDYNANAVNGEITEVNEDIIRYRSPDFPIIDTITVNNRSINLNILSSAIIKPQIINPNNGDVGGTDYVYLEANEFKHEGFNNLITHLYSQWQIGSDNNFNNVIMDSGNVSGTHLYHYQFNGLTTNNTYYARVRYVGHDGNNNITSEFSNGVVFSTSQVYTPSGINIGDNFEGGYYAGIIKINEIRYYIIVSPKEYEFKNIEIKSNMSHLPEDSYSLNDGYSNTMAMIRDGNPREYVAAHKVNKLNINGYNDWYIPSRDELELIWRNLKPVDIENNISARPKPRFKKDMKYEDYNSVYYNGLNENSEPYGGEYTKENPGITNNSLFVKGNREAMSFGSNYYWGSTAFDKDSCWIQVYLITHPGLQDAFSVNKKRNLRAVRRVRVD